MTTRLAFGSVRLGIVVVLFLSLLPGTVPGDPQTLPEEGHREQPGDEPGPLGRDQARRSPAAVVVRGNHVSVQVNVDSSGGNIVGDAANEPSMAIDPTNPDNIIIGWRQFDTILSNFRQAGMAYSRDGGVGWVFPGVLQPGQFRSDPVLSADNDGVFYYYSLSTVTTVEMFISNDKGSSWLGPFPAFGGDKEWMIADVSGTAGAGNIYALWNSQFTCCAAGTDFTRSTDGGFIYEGPFVMPVKLKWGTLDVSEDGRLYVVGSDLNTNATPSHYVMRSTNASDPTQTPVFEQTSGVNLGGRTVAGGAPNPGGLLGQVWVAVARGGPRLGEVYVLGSVDEPGTDPLDVRIARSVDSGQTWFPSVRVNDVTIGYQWFGAMSVSPGGRIDATWYDTRNDVSGRTSEVYYAYSTDGGTSWSGSLAVSPAFNSVVGHPNQNKIGDYTQMVSDDTGAALAYAATFNDEQDVWFVRVGDCNNSGVHDSVDIASGTSQDCDDNGHPDECDDLVEICSDDVDNDCNGAIDCEDEACIDDAACVCNFNGVCDLGEDCQSCPSDCPAGLVGCGNGVCESSSGEDCLSCAEDCAGLQSGNPNDQFCCGALAGTATNPVNCTDARCNTESFECVKNFLPACCGDLVCEDDENPCDCPLDCGSQTATELVCGDAIDNDCDGAADCGDDDCIDVTTAPPDGAPQLVIEQRDAAFVMSWVSPGGASFDVVEGDLNLLITGGGDFASSTTRCLADDIVETEVVVPSAAGPSRWYLVRPTYCPGAGSYDTGLPGQLGPRDPGIDAAAACQSP